MSTSLTEVSIKRPVFLIMIFGLLIVFGIISISRIGITMMPNLDFPYVTVATMYPGAGPTEIETTVTKPIEDAVSSINGIEHIMSWSYEGMSVVALQFKLNVNGDNARNDVQKKVDEVVAKMPDDVKTPSVQKVDFSAMPIMSLAVTSTSRPLNEIYEMVDRRVKDRIQQIDGVADIIITGEKERQINITVDTEKLAHHGLTILSVVDSLSMHNLDVPAGLMDTPDKEFSVRLAGRFITIKDIREMPLFTPSGTEIRLENVAKVEDGFKKMTSFSRLNGKPCLGIAIRPQSGANSVQVTNSVKQLLLHDIKSDLPADMVFTVTYEQAKFTMNSVNEVRNNLLEAIFLTGIIIFIFLANIRHTLIILFAIPTCLISAFSLMYYGNFTINIVSLIGLAVSIGILVDDSIVVLENTDRHFKMGKNPFKAALDGRNEIGLAAVAITLTHVSVFIPIAFMGGIVGRIFTQFGLTVAFTVLLSLFVSFTLTPMLASRWLKHIPGKEAEKESRLMLGLREIYGRLISWALGHRKTVIAVALASFVFSLALVPLGWIGSEFVTKPDQRIVMIDLETPIGTSLEKTDDTVRIIESRLAAVPEVETFFVTLGSSSSGVFGGSSGNQLGSFKLILRPKTSENRTTIELTEAFRAMADDVPGATLRVYEADIVAGGGDQNMPIQIEVSGTDTADFAEASRMIAEAVKDVRGLIEINTSWKKSRPEIKAVPDVTKCSAMEIPTALLARTMRVSVDGNYDNKFREGDQEYDIMISLPEDKKENLQDIKAIKVKTMKGGMVELSQVADVRKDYGPKEIRRKDKSRMFVVSANIKGRPMGDVSAEVTKIVGSLRLPGSITKFMLGGEAERMGEAFGALIFAFFLSVLFVYMVMAALFESLLYPFIIMFSLPVTAVGALGGLALFGKTLNIFSMIGMVMLVGLVVSNGILLIDFTNSIRKSGLSRREALIQAGKTRLRPILMMTLSMMFGMLPLALQLGPGSEMRSGMAVVIMGGMLSSTLLTLVFIPVVYTVIDDMAARIRRLFGMKPVVEVDIDAKLREGTEG